MVAVGRLKVGRAETLCRFFLSGGLLFFTISVGLRHEADVAQARQEGYVEGRNEQIEVRRRSFDTVNPRDDGGIEEDPDLPLLRHIRRSVWD